MNGAQDTTNTEVFVARVEDLDDGDVIVVQLDTRIAVFRDGDEFFAVDDRCTHQEAYLSDGFVEDGTVECPLHASCFDLRTGRPSGPPALQPVRTHPVIVRDGSVFVRTTAEAP
ncbi:bifunctional 3-phenylpropionate/cinnamic acid dioxygenase ferredoxin subunit [Streptomyces griseorubiginosus]|uniref:bifunctional 3-phenylpropionate/cinnamic acid dioxygenase ferredoxin subunit n=1 Tax=Streptomyces griseorubiginosus TaxID=67304 RepID=UPI001AD62E47|nr:bifunctional 3-phenylpropionate/cinnamic acid dioxygenase ferredoxin subunit [Streptomyces griseorubiginosus]MBO4257799.1 bifunctional 3-phenylpropionate/cinnamic acid dioxygenase ferredoxin subunit [Streptomyces griseorubiginosus]